MTAHFSRMGVLEFAGLHIPLIVLVLWTSYRAQDTTRPDAWRFLAYAFQWQFAFNAIFHLGAAALFQDYSPGMVTAAVVAIPATAFMTAFVRRHGILSRSRTLGAIALGATVAASAIGALFI